MEGNTKSREFLIVLNNHKGIIYKVANSYATNSDDRLDLIQEITFQLWRSFDNYNKEFQYSTWIYRIALNVSISFLRQEKKRIKGTGSLDESSIFEQDKSEPMSEEISLLNKLISELPDLDKALMILYLDEKSHSEISEILGISNSNVGTKINRIKKKLKLKFQNKKINKNER